MTEEEAKTRLLPPVDKGSYVVVIRGRKVPQGTHGTVRWCGDGEWGPRVGIAVAGKEKLVYTSLKNVDAVYPGLEPRQTPEGGWVNLLAQVERERFLPQKGHLVRHKTTAQEGPIFWISPNGEGRIGFRDKGVKGKDSAVWADIREIMFLGEHGVPLDYVDVIKATAEQPPPRVPVPPNHHLPHPFCDIRSLQTLPDGQFAAFSATGGYIATLPAEAVEDHLYLQVERLRR